MASICPQCNVEYKRDPESGNVYCPQCASEPTGLRIVSDVTFSETASGKAVVTGQYVSNDSAGVVGSSLYGMQTGESRRQTIEKAKIRLDRIGRRLGIPEHVVEGGHRIFKLALTNNFVKGRKSQHVLSACLYLSCRMGKTEHMLMDFAEALRVNVFNIGATYLQLVKNQNIKKMPVVDPTVFIQRFVSKLDFGPDGSRRVINDAKLLVQRMGKDWLQQGRRPAGVAAACILLATRMNSYRRSKAEIVQVAMIAEETLQRRLDEFKVTPAGTLSVQDFRDTNVDSAADPPSFTRHRELEKLFADKKAREEEREAQGLPTHDIYLDKELATIARELDQDDGRTLELKKDVEAVLRIPELQAAYAAMETYEEKVKREAAAKKAHYKLMAGLEPDSEDEPENNDIMTEEQEAQVQAMAFGGSIDSIAKDEEATVKESDDPVKEQDESESEGLEPETEGEDEEGEDEEGEDEEVEDEKAVNKAEECAEEGDTVKVSDSQIVAVKPSESQVEAESLEEAVVKVKEAESEEPETPRFVDDDPALPRLSASLAHQLPPFMRPHSGPGRAERFLLEFRKKRAQRLAEEAEAARVREAAPPPPVAEVENLSDVDDAEIESVILTEEEIEIKTKVWMSINREFLIEQERKRLRAEHDKANGVTKQFRKKRKTQKRGNTTGSQGGATAGDSAANMVKERAHSKKINYAALSNLFNNA